jgi:Uma2 family endonuclease
MANVIETPTEEAPVRLRYCAEDARRMVAAGVLDANLRYEVLEGEIVPMMALNPPHARVERWLVDRLHRMLDESVWIDLEAGADYTLPDVFIYPRRFAGEEVRGPDILLLIEVADRTLKQDRTKKARLYARYGVREYWVLDAQRRAVHVHRAPVGRDYASVQVVQSFETLTPELLPGLALRLEDVE